MMQAYALLVQSIRELRSRSLFWVSLILSVAVAVVLIAPISFTEDGWRLLWFSVNESDLFRDGSQGSRDLMAWIFAEIFLRWWVCWGAIALAVMSTASILPDFLSTGTIDLSLARPISRLRLLWLKIGGGFLFVAVQTTASILIAFLILGLKFDIWMPAALWAIPLVLVQFIYLYAISSFIAVWMRSSLAAMMLTLLLWAGFSIVQFASNTIDQLREQGNVIVTMLEETETTIRDRAAAQNRELTPFEQTRIDDVRENLPMFESQVEFIDSYLTTINLVEWIIPKTGDIQKTIASRVSAPSMSE